MIDLKDIAVAFLKEVTRGEIQEAYNLHIGEDFIHHNVYFKGDAESLKKAMEENQIKFPNKIAEIKHVLHDGEMVAVHSHVRMSPEDKLGVALVHIFRFKEDKIVEAWDLGQPVPKDAVNENGAF